MLSSTQTREGAMSSDSALYRGERFTKADWIEYAIIAASPILFVAAAVVGALNLHLF